MDIIIDRLNHLGNKISRTRLNPKYIELEVDCLCLRKKTFEHFLRTFFKFPTLFPEMLFYSVSSRAPDLHPVSGCCSRRQFVNIRLQIGHKSHPGVGAIPAQAQNLLLSTQLSLSAEKRRRIPWHLREKVRETQPILVGPGMITDFCCSRTLEHFAVQLSRSGVTYDMFAVLNPGAGTPRMPIRLGNESVEMYIFRYDELHATAILLRLGFLDFFYSPFFFFFHPRVLNILKGKIKDYEINHPEVLSSSEDKGRFVAVNKQEDGGGIWIPIRPGEQFNPDDERRFKTDANGVKHFRYVRVKRSSLFPALKASTIEEYAQYAEKIGKRSEGILFSW